MLPDRMLRRSKGQCESARYPCDVTPGAREPRRGLQFMAAGAVHALRSRPPTTTRRCIAHGRGDDDGPLAAPARSINPHERRLHA